MKYLVRVLVSACFLCVLVALTGWMFMSSQKDSRLEVSDHQVGPAIDVSIVVTKVDAQLNSAQVTWWAEVVDESASLGEKKIVLEAPQLSDDEITLTNRGAVVNKVATLELVEGDILYYPFDRYPLTMSFSAYSGDENIPVRVALEETDPSFTLLGSTGFEGDVSSAYLSLERSGASKIFAAFMFISMWVLALAVVAATFVIIRQKSGLLWPALSWMAATLFALVAFRNAAPGSPPLGVLYDAISFFWAEALVVISLATIVIHGVIRELTPTS